MLGLNLFFIVAVPVLLALLSAYASKPSPQQYRGPSDESGEAPPLLPQEYNAAVYWWLADVGLAFQLAGLTTTIAAVLDRRLEGTIFGTVFVLAYVIGMFFGLVRYREHREWSKIVVPRGIVRMMIRNIPFLVGSVLLVGVSLFVIVGYLLS